MRLDLYLDMLAEDYFLFWEVGHLLPRIESHGLGHYFMDFLYFTFRPELSMNSYMLYVLSRDDMARSYAIWQLFFMDDDTALLHFAHNIWGETNKFSRCRMLFGLTLDMEMSKMFAHRYHNIYCDYRPQLDTLYLRRTSTDDLIRDIFKELHKHQEFNFFPRKNLEFYIHKKNYFYIINHVFLFYPYEINNNKIALLLFILEREYSETHWFGYSLLWDLDHKYRWINLV